MYLAGLVADGSQMTRKQLQAWAEGAANMPMISEYTVPWVTLDNSQARELALEWIKSKNEHIASSGWCAYAGLLATRSDDALDPAESKRCSRPSSGKSRQRQTGCVAP
jgi:hypothetical protein